MAPESDERYSILGRVITAGKLPRILRSRPGEQIAGPYGSGRGGDNIVKKLIVPLALLVSLATVVFVGLNRPDLQAGGVTPTIDGFLPLVLNPAGTSAPSPTSITPPTATPTQTSPPTSTSVPTGTSPPTNTPTVTSTPAPAPSGDVRITDIFYDGSGPNEPDEYVQIMNFDDRPIQLQDWTLRDEANHVFTFPAFLIQPGQPCRVYTNENHPTWCGFNYGSGSAIWNNSGDCGYLRDGGNQLIDTYCY